MLTALWKMLPRHALCGVALLAAANLAQAQGSLPPIPQTRIMPTEVLFAPKGELIKQVQETPAPPAVRTTNAVQAPAALGQPMITLAVAPTADAAPPSTNAADELKARIDRLEKQNQDLLEMLKSLQNRPVPAPTTTPTSIDAGNVALNQQDVQKMVNEYLSTRADAGKAAGSAAALPQNPSFIVGKSVGLSGVWKNHQPWFETADQAFRIHIGGRFQPDWVFGASADDAVVNGKGGIGSFTEGFNFRRARLEVDGWVHEVVDFMVEYDFANQFSSGQPFTIDPTTGAVVAARNSDANTFGVPAPTDVWAGINYIPVIGGVRIGSLKPAIGLDHLTSSRYLDFLERSIGFDTYYNRNNGFAPGFMVFNYTENQRLAWQLSATKPNNTLFGWSTGGGEWDYAARLTGLPYYEDNGRRMVHLGFGAKYIDHLDQGRANLNDRWLLRQGGPNLQNVVSQVNAVGASQVIINPEFFMNLGPLSVQAEYIASQVNGVTSFVTQLTGSTPVKVSARDFRSQTAYVQAMYFLTGESRPYSKSALHGSGAAPTRVVPFRNYFWVPGQAGNDNPFSAGAWQVGARYCWSDLNDNGINGGTVNEVTLGLNWFLNPNMKFQWNYDIGHRSLAGGTSDGYFYGFGMRMAFDF